MLIILEGPDGVGKTTFARTFSDFERVHSSIPPSGRTRETMMNEYLSIIARSKIENIILDRAWHSEIIYGKIMRGESLLTYDDMVELEAKAASAGLLIFIMDHPGKIWERCQRKGEDYITDRETFDMIFSAYKHFTKIPHAMPTVTSYFPPRGVIDNG